MMHKTKKAIKFATLYFASTATIHAVTQCN